VGGIIRLVPAARRLRIAAIAPVRSARVAGQIGRVVGAWWTAVEQVIGAL
jgi:hypothetical protein